MWFSPVPNTISNSVVVDTTAHTKVNGNFASLVTDGNAGKTSILAALTGIGPVGVPSGAVIIWNGAKCPTGYQTADGTNSTADARGVYIRGLDSGAGVDPGRTLGSYQADMFIQHSHGSPALVQFLTSDPGSNAGSSAYIGTYATTTPNTTGEVTGSPGATETRPPTTVVLYCEKM